ncbi:DUF4011 domain-containing protein, partial [Methanocorpusculum sp.]
MEKGIVELEELRSRLLDLTVRNNLLNYKPSPGRSIEVIDCDPAEIYRLLVLEEKGMRFYPASKASRSESEDKRIWKYPTSSPGLEKSATTTSMCLPARPVDEKPSHN